MVVPSRLVSKEETAMRARGANKQARINEIHPLPSKGPRGTSSPRGRERGREEGLLPCVAMQPCSPKRLRERAQLAAVRESRLSSPALPLYLGGSSIISPGARSASPGGGEREARRAAIALRHDKMIKRYLGGTATQGTLTLTNGIDRTTNKPQTTHWTWCETPCD